MTAAKKKAFVARMKKARKNPGSNKRKGPARKTGHSHNPRRKSTGARNPQVLGRTPGKLLKEILTALGSAVLTKQVPQEILQSGNTGWQGYVANLVTAIAATIGAHALFGPDEALAAALGGGVVIADRVLTENFSPIGAYLALTGLGDATAARQLGSVGDGYYIQPVVYDTNGNPIIPHQITDAAVQRFLDMAPPPAANGGGAAQPQLTPGGATPNRYKRGLAGN